VTKAERDRAKYLFQELPHIDMFAIDVANGHSIQMKEMIEYVKTLTNDSVPILAGNVATGEGFTYLASLGVSAVRVGIGGGSICQTRIMTGVGVPTLSSVVDCSIARRNNDEFANVAIIADGGIRYPQDLVKSLVAGADAIIGGRIFAGTEESPGEVMINDHGERVKEYRGMASRKAQEARGTGLKPGTVAEGVSTYLSCQGPAEEVIERFTGGLRSAMTYFNATDLDLVRKNAKMIRITEAGLGESHAFGTRI
jgi:IMP dehydrogenase